MTNNGPSGDANAGCGSCGDIFDIIGTSPGITFQWPYCWGYSHQISGQPSCAGMRAPNFSTENCPSCNPAIPQGNPYFVAPTGMTYANGHWLFCAYSTDTVFQYNGQGNVSDAGIGQCGLDVKQAPDGAIYTASDSAITRH